MYYRSLLKNKQDSIIKMIGLSVGLACIIVIYLFIDTEFSFDRFHEDSNQIYRIQREAEVRGNTVLSALASPLMGEMILNELPEVEEMTRLFTYSWQEEAQFTYKDKQFFEKKMFLVDPSFFNFFSFKLIKGDPVHVFDLPNAIVLSESCAKKYFGDQNPMGKSITLKNFGSIVFTVKGIIQSAPENSHFSFDVLVSTQMGEHIYWKPFLNTWGNNSFYTYIKVRKGVDPEILVTKINELAKNRHEGSYGIPEYDLMPMTDIHFYSHTSDEIEKNGNINHLIFAFIIGLVISIISLSNFVNITNAQIIFRAREVGIKKLFGEIRLKLFYQFIFESVILSFVSMIIALIMIEIAISHFASLLGINVDLYSTGILIYLKLILLVALFGVLAGLFPAIMYSAFNTINVLKGRLWKTNKKISVQRIIMAAQFIIVAVLMVSTFVVNKQKKFLINDDPGFSVENVIVVPLKDYSLLKNYQAFKDALKTGPYIENVAGSSALPMNVRRVHEFECEGNDETIQMTALNVDFDFLELYNMELIEGRRFDKSFSADSKISYIINQTAAKMLGWDRPIGKIINYSNKGLKLAEFEEGKVIGLVADFHHSSRQNMIEPLVMKVYPDAQYVSIRFKDGYYEEALSFIKSKYDEVNPNKEFAHFLGVTKYNELYQDEARMNQVFMYSTIIAIVIALMGLFSLSSLEMKRKFREIGIKKVFGAETSSLLVQFLKQYGWLVLISNLIAFPIAWIIMDEWLNGFAYSVSFTWYPFLLAFAITAFVSIVTVVGQVIQAASKNPVESLKYE